MASSSVKAAVLHGAQDLRIVERTIAPPGPLEVQVHIKATTLCGSDSHYFAHGRNGAFELREPLILGHESAGIIVAVGSSVARLQVGTRVALEAGVACSQCSYCLGGRYNLCPDLRFGSSAKTFPHLDGFLVRSIRLVS